MMLLPDQTLPSSKRASFESPRTFHHFPGQRAPRKSFPQRLCNQFPEWPCEAVHGIWRSPRPIALPYDCTMMTFEFKPVFVRELTVGFRNCVVVNSKIDCEHPDRR